MSDCPSRFNLVRLKTGDLEDREAASVNAHVGACERCRASMDSLEKNIAAFEPHREDHLRRLMDRIDAEPIPFESRRPSLFARLTVVGGLAAAAALAFGLFVVLGTSPKETPDDSIRFKGHLSLEVIAKRGERQFKVEQGSALTEDDAVRFIVTTASPGYLDLFSVDAEGTVSPFYPESDPSRDPAPMQIASPGRHVLPGSVILDGALGHEDFVVVFSKTAFDREEVQNKIQLEGEKVPQAIIESRGESSYIFVERLTIRKE
jgi:hypothetical protein